MGLTLTKHEITHSGDELAARTKGQIIQYRVDGLPSAERAYIANFGAGHEDSWRVFHTKKGIYAYWDGDYKTADAALAALQKEY